MRNMTTSILPQAFALLLAAGHCNAARFTDTFTSSPGALGHRPFVWNQFNAYHGAETLWRTVPGTLEYRAEKQTGTYTGFGFAAAGIRFSDAPHWSLETGFRHLSGIVPKDYLYIAYVRWHVRQAGRMCIVGLAYDPAKKQLFPYNSVGAEAPVAADLSGDFHAVRLTVGKGAMRIYVDDRLAGGPYKLKTRAYVASEDCLIGPMTKTKKHSLHCQWDYLAFTDEGAFAPGEGRWHPADDREPVAEELAVPTTPDVFHQPPYAGIKVISKEKGGARWEQALPEAMIRYRSVRKATPSPIETGLYHYPDKGPTRQNVHQNPYVLKYDEKRCVANVMLTRGIDDTATGFMDYKMWYRVSTDGGHTYGKLRPIIERGAGYSAMHPIEYVYVGKNSFCYATVPGIMLRLSNGQIFFPCYYAPLDADGHYYNPLNAYTFSRVCGIIGTWNKTGDDLVWDVSRPVILDPDQASRGAGECAVIELRDKPGWVLMVIRGSNEPNPTGKIPACKWKTLSTDYGKTWSPCEPFTFDDGTSFLSPASCCSFIRSSRTGKCYWVGNISRTLPRGDWPRYPLVIGELDEEKLALRRETVTIIDDRTPEDPPSLQLSNYGLLEDEKTGELILHLNRMVPGKKRPGSGPYTYVIRVK